MSPIEFLRLLLSSEIGKQLRVGLTRLGNFNAGCNVDGSVALEIFLKVYWLAEKKSK